MTSRRTLGTFSGRLFSICKVFEIYNMYIILVFIQDYRSLSVSLFAFSMDCIKLSFA